MNSHTRVTGKFLVPVGSEEKALSGEVSFIAKADSIRGDGKIYLPAPVTVQLDEAGAFAVDLLVPADGLQPSAWSWEAVPSLSYEGAMVPWCSFFFDPAGKAEVDLSEVAPVPDPVTGDFVTRGEVGPTPELSIGEVVTVGPGEEAVTITGPAEAPVLDFALPRGRLGWTGDRGPQGLPGEKGDKGDTGEPGVSLASVSSAGEALVLGMSDGVTHRVPIPVGLIGQGASGGITVLGDGTASASGALAWEDRGDGTGVVSPAPGKVLSFTATAHEVPAGQSPSVEVLGTFPDFTLSVGVPTGAQGSPGEKGAPGEQGPQGLTGPKGEPGNPAALVLVGAGRPDVSSTLSPENRTAVANSLVGATFTSTDGAGVGAWAWVKTPTGWQVTYGDTGWRDVSSLLQISDTIPAWPPGTVLLRRVGSRVELSYSLPSFGPITVQGAASTETKLLLRSQVPGFTPEAPPRGGYRHGMSVTSVLLSTQNGAPLNGYITWQYDSGDARFRDLVVKHGTEKTAAARMTYLATDPWPATLPGSPA